MKRAVDNIESQPEPSGNTETLVSGGARKRVKQDIQCWKWCFTLGQEHESQKIQNMRLWRLLKEHCKKFTFQLERGEGGFLHFQGQFSLQEKKRMGELKNLLGLNWIHLEPTKNIFAAEKYTQKDDSRVAGPWSETKMPLKPIIEELYPWQEALIKEWEQVADRRKVVWYYDPVGKRGKSTFAIHLSRLGRGYLRISGDKDRAQNVKLLRRYLDETNVVVFDIERDDFFKFDYGILAELKNGQICDGSYKGEIMDFDSPHVIVFANYKPNLAKLSDDRWEVREF
jgi:hypothetical protein